MNRPHIKVSSMMMRWQMWVHMVRFRVALISAACLLGACASPPSPSASTNAASPAQADPVLMVAAIRAAVGSGEGELSVQPLRDPMVEDLREQASVLEQQRKYPESAAALDQALGIVPDDPAVLQERAEAALLLNDFAGAEQRAQRAWEIGSQVGPLCRRHWATVRAVRFAARDGAGAARARQQMDACKVAGPQRY